jgi:hypothetical protein
MSDIDQIQKLLRLKRYEQPPDGYFDDFLFEFQKRQRADLLRQPVWQIAWERLNSRLVDFRVPAVAYASILAVAVGVTGLMITGNDGADQAALASTSSETVAQDPRAELSPVTPLPATAIASSLPPSYVLETRPVSYEPPSSF